MAGRTDPPDLYEVVFSALAHPARRRIVMTLNFGGGQMSAGDIAALFEHSWPTTSRHIRVLQSAGLVSSERVGRSRLYRIETQRLGIVRDWLNWFFTNPNGLEPTDEQSPG